MFYLLHIAATSPWSRASSEGAPSISPPLTPPATIVGKQHVELSLYMHKLCAVTSTIRQHGSAVYVGMVVVVCML